MSVDLPNQVTCKIESTDVALKGQTVSSSYKPAILTNGMNIQVPPFIEAWDEVIVDTRNLEYIKKSIDSHKGLLLFTPHLGNIEILINYLGSITACTIPYTMPKNKNLDRLITKSRNDAGVEMVNTDPKGIKKLLLALKEGNTVAMASDQVPKRDSGIISKFFNTDIYSLTLVPKLQQKTQCAAHLMYCERKQKGEGFIVHFSKEISLPPELQKGVDKMNNEFEKCIMKIPEQYSWEYKKFKRNNKESIY